MMFQSEKHVIRELCVCLNLISRINPEIAHCNQKTQKIQTNSRTFFCDIIHVPYSVLDMLLNPKSDLGKLLELTLKQSPKVCLAGDQESGSHTNIKNIAIFEENSGEMIWRERQTQRKITVILDNLSFPSLPHTSSFMKYQEHQGSNGIMVILASGKATEVFGFRNVCHRSHSCHTLWHILARKESDEYHVPHAIKAEAKV